MLSTAITGSLPHADRSQQKLEGPGIPQRVSEAWYLEGVERYPWLHLILALWCSVNTCWGSELQTAWLKVDPGQQRTSKVNVQFCQTLSIRQRSLKSQCWKLIWVLYFPELCSLCQHWRVCTTRLTATIKFHVFPPMGHCRIHDCRSQTESTFNSNDRGKSVTFSVRVSQPLKMFWVTVTHGPATENAIQLFRRGNPMMGSFVFQAQGEKQLNLVDAL